MKKINELERILETECPKYEKDCSKCPYAKECEEYYQLNKGGNENDEF